MAQQAPLRRILPDWLLEPDDPGVRYLALRGWKFSFPVFYVTDLLQVVEAHAGLGYGDDHRLGNAVHLAGDEQDALGRWPLQYDFAGKTCAEFGPKKATQPVGDATGTSRAYTGPTWIGAVR